MAIIVAGTVKDGLVVPQVPLPEGTRVEIRVLDALSDIPPELQGEFEAWDQASARALELVERLAQAGTADDQR